MTRQISSKVVPWTRDKVHKTEHSRAGNCVGTSTGRERRRARREVKEERNRKEVSIISVGLHIITFSLSFYICSGTCNSNDGTWHSGWNVCPGLWRWVQVPIMKIFVCSQGETPTLTVRGCHVNPKLTRTQNDTKFLYQYRYLPAGVLSSTACRLWIGWLPQKATVDRFTQEDQALK